MKYVSHCYIHSHFSHTSVESGLRFEILNFKSELRRFHWLALKLSVFDWSRLTNQGFAFGSGPINIFALYIYAYMHPLFHYKMLS